MNTNSADALPIYLQWLGFGLAVFSAVGVLLVLPTLLQIFLGGPQLHKEFDSHDEDGSRLLLVFMKNLPVEKPFGRFALVKRDTIESLAVTFQILDACRQSIIVPVHQARIQSGEDSDELGRYRIRLPPTFSVGASIAVAMWNAASGRAEIPPTQGKQSVPLDPGIYEARSIFHIDGRRNDVAKNFSVGQTVKELEWL